MDKTKSKRDKKKSKKRSSSSSSSSSSVEEVTKEDRMYTQDLHAFLVKEGVYGSSAKPTGVSPNTAVDKPKTKTPSPPPNNVTVVPSPPAGSRVEITLPQSTLGKKNAFMGDPLPPSSHV